MKKVVIIILCLTLVVCNLTACKKEVRTIEPSGEISEENE